MVEDFPVIVLFVVLFLSMSSAVGRLLWFQSDGPGVGRHDVTTAMDSAGVNALVELIGDDAEVSVLHDNVSGDGGQDLLAIFIPAAEKIHFTSFIFQFSLRFYIL